MFYFVIPIPTVFSVVVDIRYSRGWRKNIIHKGLITGSYENPQEKSNSTVKLWKQVRTEKNWR